MVEQFPIVLRGYDKDRVDEAFASAQETVNRLREQVKADDQTILELQAQLQEEKNKKAAPKSFASLGANAQQMLASAEQTSAELLERAKKDASAARATVQLQAETLLNNAKIDARRIMDDANAKAAKVLAMVPHELAVLETDCPYMSPEPVRGTRNDSRNIAHVAAKIGEIWQMDAQSVLDLTAENAKRIFNQ